MRRLTPGSGCVAEAGGRHSPIAEAVVFRLWQSCDRGSFRLPFARAGPTHIAARVLLSVGLLLRGHSDTPGLTTSAALGLAQLDDVENRQIRNRPTLNIAKLSITFLLATTTAFSSFA